MPIADILLPEFDHEMENTRKALERIPDGKFDWKPHPKSMIFGYLANMVATIPMWIMMQINQDELDIAPKDGGYLVGDALTLADIAVAGPFANLQHLNVQLDDRRYPKTVAFTRRILSRPSFAPWIAREAAFLERAAA